MWFQSKVSGIIGHIGFIESKYCCLNNTDLAGREQHCRSRIPYTAFQCLATQNYKDNGIIRIFICGKVKIAEKDIQSQLGFNSMLLLTWRVILLCSRLYEPS